MPFVIALMGLAILMLVVLLWNESNQTARLETEVRMLRERYEPDNTSKEK